MPSKEEIDKEIQRQIVFMLYKAYSLRDKYPELSLLEMSLRYKEDRRTPYWRKSNWIQEMALYASKMTPYSSTRDFVRFFNRYLMEPTLGKVMGISGIQNPFDILAVYKYGSRVYGSITDKSDFDYIVIKKSGPREEKSVERERVNINVISEEDFRKDLDAHEISALECWFIKAYDILKGDIDINFVLDKVKLRHSISEKASHSFVKAKKKFVVPEDKNIYAGKKSLFHSLRIIDFGIQIASSHSINFGSANHIHKEIMDNSSENWEDYQDKYKPLYNSMMSSFRLLAPKE